MSDQTIAAIARELGKAMMERAKTRSSDDQKKVLALQTELCGEILSENVAAN